MKLNKEKFMKTEMGGELEETIRTWDKAIDERRKTRTDEYFGVCSEDESIWLMKEGREENE